MVASTETGALRKIIHRTLLPIHTYTHPSKRHITGTHTNSQTNIQRHAA